MPGTPPSQGLRRSLPVPWSAPSARAACPDCIRHDRPCRRRIGMPPPARHRRGMGKAWRGRSTGGLESAIMSTSAVVVRVTFRLITGRSRVRIPPGANASVAQRKSAYVPARETADTRHAETGGTQTRGDRGAAPRRQGCPSRRRLEGTRDRPRVTDAACPPSHTPLGRNPSPASRRQSAGSRCAGELAERLSAHP